MKNRLKSLGLNQRKLCELLGTHPNTVSKWCTGRLPIPKYALAYLELREPKPVPPPEEPKPCPVCAQIRAIINERVI